MEVGAEVDNNNDNKLSKFVVGDVPTLYYIPDFITQNQQDLVVNNVLVVFSSYDQ